MTLSSNEDAGKTLTYGDRVLITYTNYKGVTSDRIIKPINIWFGSTEYHPEEQWLLHAWDEEKADFRQFAMKDVMAWKEKPHNQGNDGENATVMSG